MNILEYMLTFASKQGLYDRKDLQRLLLTLATIGFYFMSVTLMCTKQKKLSYFFFFLKKKIAHKQTFQFIGTSKLGRPPTFSSTMWI